MGLIDRVRTDDRQVVVVTAPAGYGKSTFLRQWAEREDRAVAWVSLEATDDDETVLLDYIANALERAGSLGSGASLVVGQPPGAMRTAALTRLAATMWRTEQPTVLMIDDVDQLRTADSIDALAWLAEHLPPTTRLAVASRVRLPLPLARLRARGRLLEVGTLDLAMSESEARELLEGSGLHPTDDDVVAITRRTEGWPAGIYMAALSLRAGGGGHLALPGPTRAAVLPDGMADRYAAEFLRTEVLDRLAPDLLDFLVRTSPLDRFDARLCDQALGRTGSGEVLGELERTNAFLVPLDGRSRWYRYHHLFRELLLTELRRRDPDQEVLVQHRAAAWFAAHDDPDSAVEYAHLAGDDQMVASLLVANGLRLYRAGRLATLDRWFGWFDVDELARAPRLAILGAWIWALSGRTSRAERWEDVLRPMLDELDPPTRAAYAALRAVTGRMPIDLQVEEAHIALAGVPEGDAWRANAYLGAGVQHLLHGDPAAADVLMVRAIDHGIEIGGIPAATTALGIRAHIAMARGDWGHADELTRRARSLIAEYRLEGYGTSALAFATGAHVAAHAGAHAVAQADIAHVQRVRPILTATIPYLAARVRLEVAHAYLALGEVAGARLMLAEVADLIAVRPGIAPLAAEMDGLRARAGGMTSGRAGAATLTTAELRLLGYLPSHLSFREIADRLYVSINTVKTQAISIYTKLGVSSRSAAIDAAVAQGLLDSSATRFPPVAADLVLERRGEATTPARSASGR
ncbi:MAG: AAA family ATPase [Chloroflexota bacterium]